MFVPLPPLLFIVVIALLALANAPLSTLAYSAQLFESASCSPSTVLAYSEKLESGACVPINRASSKVREKIIHTCAATGLRGAQPRLQCLTHDLSSASLLLPLLLLLPSRSSVPRTVRSPPPCTSTVTARSWLRAVLALAMVLPASRCDSSANRQRGERTSTAVHRGPIQVRLRCCATQEE